jgi:hypothetical protein
MFFYSRHSFHAIETLFFVRTFRPVLWSVFPEYRCASVGNRDIVIRFKGGMLTFTRDVETAFMPKQFGIAEQFKLNGERLWPVLN